ncbi:ATP-binding protein [Candidatus Riflebacteria bacterium]
MKPLQAIIGFQFFKSIRNRLVFYFLLISLFSITLVGYEAFLLGKAVTENRVIEQLTTVADQKLIELKRWLNARIKDTKTLSEEPEVRNYLTLYTGKAIKDSEPAKKKHYYNLLKYKLQTVKRNYGYKKVLLADTDGRLVVSSDVEVVGKKVDEKFISPPLKNGEPFIRDIYRSKEGEFLMAFSYPVYRLKAETWRKSAGISGVAVAIINMSKSLFLMLGNWPGMGNTGETLLVRKEGENILFLNELRHLKDTALKLRIPLVSGLAKPAVFASSGDEGMIRTTDYRQEPVLAAYRHIAQAGWGFVTKIDVAEAFLSIEKFKFQLIKFTLILVIIAIGIAYFISRTITNPILKLKKLTEKLAEGDFGASTIENSHDEVGALSSSFRKMAEALEDYSINMEEKVKDRTRLLNEKNIELQRFTYTVSHDLRSPIVTIKGFLGLLEKDALSGNIEKLKKDITYINNATDKMENLLNELLHLSRIGFKTNPKREISIEVLIEDLLREALGELVVNNVQVKIAPDLPGIYGDLPRISELFQNLLENANKYRGETDNLIIEVGCREENGEIIFFVRDNGIGIEPCYHEKVFDLFEKLEEKSQGTGIGLAIVKRVVEMHGGRIWVESEGEGKGSCFNFTLSGQMH